MASDPVVTLCEALMADADVQRSDTLRMAARALLVAWEALRCTDPGGQWCEACRTRERIRAIVEGRDA